MEKLAPRPARLGKGSIVELPIYTLALGGRGIGRLDNFVVFVSGAVPGDVVRAQVTKCKKQYAEARVQEILIPSPDRRPAACASFGQCGGCTWQTLDYQVQLEYKARQVRESLVRLGSLRDFKLGPIIGMADPWRYRNRADFSVGISNAGAVVGFRPAGCWDEVLPLGDCHLLPPVINQIRATVEKWLRSQSLPGWDPRTATGFVRHILVRSAQLGKEVLVSLVTAPGELPHAQSLVDQLRSAHPELVGVLHAVNSSRAEISAGLEPKTLWGRPYVLERVSGLTLRISADAFFQTNTLMAHALYGLVAQEAGMDRAESGRDEIKPGGEEIKPAPDEIKPGGEEIKPSGASPPSHSGAVAESTTPRPGRRRSGPVVWDLYAGVGSIGLSLSGWATAVLGIEAVPAAVKDARRNAALNHVANAYFLQGDVPKVLRSALDGSLQLPEEVGEPDVVIVDPPRAGLSKKAISRVAELQAPRIVYVSCNPASMAPNLAQLEEYGYRLERATPVDMFPHTPHVECVALLTQSG